MNNIIEACQTVSFWILSGSIICAVMSGKSAAGMFGWYSNAADADLGEQLQEGNTGLPMFCTCTKFLDSLF
jgi:hypothetical protein